VTFTRQQLAEPDPAVSAPSAWQPMKDAPRNKPVLLRSKWNSYPLAIVGIYVAVHGTFCTQNIFGQGEHQIFADGWADIPELEGSLQ
jgi:hypothetical protein